MCLYETKLRNPHYLTNEKNGGKIPPLTDSRKLYIQTKCGWCSECRAEIARNWKIRLLEEYKANNRAYFITLSFAPKHIKDICETIKEEEWQGYQGEEIEANMVAAYGIRKFCENWRKTYKKAPRHWCITELGHNSTQRIHIHGLIFENNTKIKDWRNAIKQLWHYGHIYIGKWVNEATINYIIKYITKIDNEHKGYLPRIFTSKGLGKTYIDKNKWKHEFNRENTNTKYKDSKGYEYELPKYYKNKLWTAEQKEKLWTIALDKKESYIKGIKYDLSQQDDIEEREKYIQALNEARKDNKRQKFGDNKTTRKKYIITKSMTMTNEELELNKPPCEITMLERRKTEKTEEWQDKKSDIDRHNTEELNKGMDCQRIILGEYINGTTAAQRKYNEELKQAKTEKLSVRQIRLKNKGLPYK